MTIHILHIEDEEALLDYAKTALTNLGYMYTAAINGKDALNKLEKISPDIIICNYKMPEMNGVQFLVVDIKYPALFLSGGKDVKKY